jgi:hypothetical protein
MVMYKYLLCLLFLSACIKMKAQTTARTLTGEYYLTNVMETACGLKLNADSSFQFFFSQGALDRYGRGRWSVKNNMLILNNRRRIPRDFKMIQSVRHDNDNITIHINDSNSLAVRYVYCIINGDGKTQQVMTNNEGIAVFKNQPVDSITLLFEFCPEKKSVFSITNTHNNYFEFSFEEWMMEIFFDDFQLAIGEDGLSGSNPVLEGKEFHYRKQ